MPTTKSAEYIGSYKILNKIGEGGMALIYKALQPSLKRTVVLKKLKDPNREIINRFKKEALLSASFHHENLVAIYEFLYTKRSYFLVMEYVDGEDLRTIIDYMAPLPAALAGLLILEIVRGLEYTHARHIIHRDIKPGNILVSYSGDVKLIDFGVAKDDVSTRLTVTGMIVGTPAYMAPEQANGEPLTVSSDLFSIGILLYELLTGVKPFYGENNTEILSKIVRNKYIPVERLNPEIPRSIRKIVRKAIHRDHKHRYQNATEMINDLENAIALQTRSDKKTVISRFLKDLDKTRQTSQTDSVKLQVFTAMPSWGWRGVRIGLLALMIFLLGFQGLRFHDRQLGYLQVSSSEAGFMVAVDDRAEISEPSAQTKIGPFLKGLHRVRVHKANAPGILEAELLLRPNATVHLHMGPTVKVDTAEITLTSTPAQANLFIDDVFQGLTPLTALKLDAGRHEIKMSKEGFKGRQETLRLKSGQFYRYQFLLEPQE